MKKILSILFIMFVTIVIPFGLRTVDAQQYKNFYSVLYIPLEGTFCVKDANSGDPPSAPTPPTDAREELQAGMEFAAANGWRFDGLATWSSVEARNLGNCGSIEVPQ